VQFALGGTGCSRPLIDAKKNDEKFDCFVVITDKETWHGVTKPSDALMQYREVSAALSFYRFFFHFVPWQFTIDRLIRVMLLLLFLCLRMNLRIVCVLPTEIPFKAVYGSSSVIDLLFTSQSLEEGIA